ncbi:MAG: hypothetical protein HQL84_05245 [Magnetococcales bacterium]|nr:hypothetical protein [Magnetococcales bacterium]MBF0149436.1 hypothetical protein [Magnetococcales bacterium]MBF0171912.1 hypothetical protein [Magnetococcales bacterium]MBF0347213.1 hypothetical protein [Magnetococcales bacterium]MBF0630487.1 hypothetical protein [Magnetococcales bacterium]
MEFVETRVFTRHLSGHLTDGSFSDLQQELIRNPELGDKIPGSGGIRKVRWESARHSTGKRGGLRIIYFHHKVKCRIYLLTLYWKGDIEDITKDEIKALKQLVRGWNHGQAEVVR